MDDSLAAYLPQDRRDALARNAELPGTTSGTALFADISGFTPLTDALTQALGARHGAETLTDQINAVYTALIAQVERYHGSVIGFAGDAITCWFDERDEPAAPRAAAAALGMQAAMASVAAIELPGDASAALSIKVAIASGAARRLAVGAPDIQRLDVLAGATIARLAILEHLAARGEVVVDAPTVAALGNTATLAAWRTDPETQTSLAVLADLSALPPAQPWPSTPVSAELVERLRPWVLPMVGARLQAGLDIFLTELRPAVALFLRFGGIDYDAPAADQQLDAFICAIQAALARYGGTLLQLTIGDKGSYLYAGFGVPRSHEDDARRAVLAALALQQLSLELPAFQIGISQGVMRCGAYGSASRRAYGVLGDEVNLAARLMSLAQPGEILISGRVQQALTGMFALDPRPPMVLKGKPEPLPVFAVRGVLRRRAIRLEEPTYALPMVGRAAELAQAEAVLARALAGQGQILGITAEAGMGKSRLVAEIVRLASQAGMRGYGGACQSYGATTPYLVWQPIWQAFFDIDPAAPLRRQLRQLEATVAELAPERLQALPLLGPLLDLPMADTDFTRMLEPQYRQSVLHALLVESLCAAARESQQDGTGLLLVLEDLHWIDPTSHDLLEQIARAITELPVLLVLAYRPPEQQRLQAPRVEALPHFTRIALDDLAATAAEALIRAKLAQLFPAQSQAVPAALIARVTAKAQGNPFYVEELLNYLRDRGLDPRAPASLAALELPSSLHSLILSRIDQLSAHEQATLKTASIIGRVFRAAQLQSAYPELGDTSALRRNLDELARLELTPLEQPEPQLAYLFKHIVTQEVSYTSLPLATRAGLHERFAVYLEGLGKAVAEQIVDLLAYHYERSDNLPKKREYLRRAGEAAAKRYALAEADDYYRRALELTPQGDWEARYDLFKARREVVLEAVTLQQVLAELEALAEALDDNRRRTEVAGFRAEYTDDLASKRAAAERMLALATATADTALIIDAHLQFAWALWCAREYEVARKHALLARDLARTVGERKREASAHFNLANIALVMGDFVLARVLYDETLLIVRTIGDLGMESVTLGNLGVSLARFGDYTAATQHFEQWLRLSYEIGLPLGNPYALQNLAWMAHLCGDDERAHRYADQALTAGRLYGDQYIEAAALAIRADARAGLGRLAEAAADYQAAQALWKQLGYRDKAGVPQAGLARLALMTGDPAGALAAITPTLAYLAEGGTFDSTDAGLLIELTCYQVLRANSDGRADDVLAAAHARLQARAVAITDDAMRQIFLGNIPWHRELLAAWAAQQAISAEEPR